jgi:glycosyltransferase involved in cell wall biosynthesis
MATYNGAKYIREQLDDLAAQTHLPAELVVCDDGSTDGTLDIVEQFATTAPFPVRIHRNPERLGYRANFINCAGLCSSDLIAFCDQDDRWLPQKLEAVVTLFDDDDVLLVHHNAHVITAERSRIGFLCPKELQLVRWSALERGAWPFAYGFTQIFRRSLAILNKLWLQSEDQNVESRAVSLDHRVAHDYWYLFLASVLGTTIYTPELLAEYRQHDANTAGLYRPSVPRRLSKEVRNARATCTRRYAGATSRASILEIASTQMDQRLRKRAVLGARMYRGLADRWRLRRNLYDAKTLPNRMKAIARLLKCGAYGRNDWKFGSTILMMDFTVGLTGIGVKH